MPEWKPGDFVAGYRIDGLIARGATANVYLANAPGGGMVALKASRLTGTLGRSRYPTSVFDHPGVVSVLGAGQWHGVPYMAMEHVRGGSLSSLLHENGRLGEADAAKLVASVAETMAAAHRRGMVHGALTPRKILLGSRRPLVEGFGTWADFQAATQATAVLPEAALDHLAPEQLAGAEPDERSDVYALGSVLYTSLAGTPPFPGASAPAEPAEMPPLPEVSAEVQAVARRALAPNPDDRYESAEALAEDLDAASLDELDELDVDEGATEESQVGFATPHEPLPPPSRPRTRGKPRRGARSPRRGIAEARDGGELPRRMFAKLEAPEVVVVGTQFEVDVGVAATPSRGVAAKPLVLPDSVRGEYVLAIQVIADGFSLAPGESWRHDLKVDARHLYPSIRLHLTPNRQHDDVTTRSIQATYTVDGQTLGLAFRPLAVVRDAEMAQGEAPAAPQVDFPAQTAEEAADLTVNITWGKEPGRLMWTFESPHGIERPVEPLLVDLRDEPEEFLRRLIDKVETYEGREVLLPYLEGKGGQLADRVPNAFWDALRSVAGKAPGKAPSVLFVSAEAYVPWELAVMPEPLDDDKPPFLCTQTTVGRWIHTDSGKPPPDPPRTATGSEMAVIFGEYQDRPLDDAVAEAAELQKVYGAAPVDATERALLACLAGTPPADLLHFAIHGRWDTSGFDDGLVMVDGTAIDPAVIRGTARGDTRPAFVFLNACQVGAGESMLGAYAGTAAAFLHRGAPGVIAPLWSIDDGLAKAIALRFYERVFAGKRPAEVLREERERFGATDGDELSATSLAFQFFGHPTMRLEREHVADG